MGKDDVKKRYLVFVTEEGRINVEFEGEWSRYEIDRSYKAVLRGLRDYKRDLMLKDMERRRLEEEEESESNKDEDSDKKASTPKSKGAKK